MEHFWKACFFVWLRPPWLRFREHILNSSEVFYRIISIFVKSYSFPRSSRHSRHVFHYLKSDFNEALFVLESRELLYKNIKIKTIFILKKGSIHKKYLNNNYFRLLFSGFIRMKVDTTLILAGCLDVTQYSLLRKWRQGTLVCQEFSALWFV